MSPKEYIWHKQTTSPDFELIECFDYDPLKDFHRDPTGVYVLVKADTDAQKIELAVCDAKGVILKAFRGGKAQDVYETLFRYEKKHKLDWFKDKGHCAYIGKELKKAELSFEPGQKNYVQE